MSGEQVPGATRYPTGQIIGRDSEMATLTAFLDRVPNGPVAMLIEGEAGIGKSTVWNGAVAEASTRNYRILGL
jgi:transcriptional regulator with GAF, ATPase, and Fis domain